MLNTPRRVDALASGRDGGKMAKKLFDSKIRDYSMLATACRRAVSPCHSHHGLHNTRLSVRGVDCRLQGKVRAEGMALYNIGVLYDNHGL